MDENKVCMSVRKYIYIILNEDDDLIFSKRSMDSLGKYLFNKIRKRVSCATNKLIKKEIFRYKRKTSSENCFLELLNQTGIKILPKDALASVKKDYEIVEKRYKSYKSAFNRKLVFLQNEDNKLKANEIKIKHKPYNKVPLTRDLTDEIECLHAYFAERERIRSYKEIIEFDEKYLSTCWVEEFGDGSLDALNRYFKQKAKSIFMGSQSRYNIFNVQLQRIYAAEANLKDELILFYKAKLIPLYEKIMLANLSKHFSQELKGEDYDITKELKIIPHIDDLIDAKINDKFKYLNLLEKLFKDFSLITELCKSINKFIVKTKRKELLVECISLFKNKKYDLLINLLPIQIEGLFYDLLIDSTSYQILNGIDIFEKPTLREKLNLLNEKIHIDIYEYFYFSFNNLIRNVVAHGRADILDDTELEIFAYELMLDLNCLMHYFVQKSEFMRMRILLQSFDNNNASNTKIDYKKKNYARLFETIIKKRYISVVHFGVEKFEPMQSLYWIVNPTYERRYCSIYGSEDIKTVRRILYSIEFWIYVNDKILECIESGYDYIGIEKSFNKILDVLLGDIKNNELKKHIVKVKANYGKLKKMDTEFNKEMRTIE